MNNEQSYPCVVNKSEKVSNANIESIFEGDLDMYRQKTIKALKKSGNSKELIKAVKTADGVLEISSFLMEADRFDILVEVFNESACSIFIHEYVRGLYQRFIEAKYPLIYINIMGNISMILKQFEQQLGMFKLVQEHLLKESHIKDIDEILLKLDRIIIVEKSGEHLRERLNKCNEITKDVLEKYYEAYVKNITSKIN